MLKKGATLFLMLLALTVVCPARAEYDGTLSTGKDWLKHMSPKEKFVSLVPPTLLFTEYDVHLRHSLPQFIQWMDNILLRNPQLEKEDVNNIFASTIYLLEPENREALKTMESDFLRGDYETGRVQAPRLTIEDVVREISREPQQ